MTSRLWLAALLVGCACQGASGLGAICARSSDCAAGLGCALEHCARACADDAQCPAGLACVTSSGGGFCLDPGHASDAGTSEAGVSDTGTIDAGRGLDAASDAARADIDADTGTSGVDADAGHTLPHGLVDGCIGTTAACAIASDHDVYCWGSAAHGALGDGAACARADVAIAARRVPGVAHVDVIACGDGFACAHQSDGRTLCWGRNDLGQLGRETVTACEGTPAPVLGATGAPLVLSSADLVGGGAHACMIDLTTGAIACWGRNDGVLDVRASADRNLVYMHASDALQPLRDATSSLSGAFVTQLAVSATGASARVTGRDLYLWGDNAHRETANAAAPQYAAVLSSGAGRGTFAIAGRVHRCALDGVGVVCWGANALGQLGHAPSAGAATCGTETCEGPGLAMGSFRSIATSGDGDTSCGLVTGGALVRCWGDNAHGLGGVPASTAPIAYLDGATPPVAFPVAAHTPFSRVIVGPRAACAIDAGSVAWCWGDHDLDAATPDVTTPTALALAAP